MIRLLICVILLFSFTSKAQELEPFFNATKNQDYEEAMQIVSEYEDSTLKTYIGALASVMAQKSELNNFALSFDKSDDIRIEFIKNLIAGYQNNYAVNQDNLQAFKYFSKAIKLSDKIGDKVLIKTALIAMLDLFATEIFIGSKQYEPYLDRFSKMKSDRTDEALLIFYNLIFFSKGDDDPDVIDAQYYSYYLKLDSIFIELPKSHPLFAKYYWEKGLYHKIETNFEKAEDFLLKADSTALKRKYNNTFRNDILWQLAHVNMLNDSLDEAKRYLNLSLKGDLKLRDTFYNDRLASAIFQKEGKYDSAYHHLRKSVDIEYQLGYKNNTLETAILTVQNQTDKLKLDKLELESSSIRNRNWAVLLGLLLVLGAVIGILVNKNTKRKQLLAEQEKILEEQKVSNMLKEQELVIIDAMVEGQEKERQRVANELHDDLGSLMAAVKLQFNSLEAKEKKGNLETFSKTEELIDEAYGKIRAIAHAKNSGLMAKQGLLQAVNQMAEKISIVNGLQISVLDYGLETRLENSMELTLFRIIQELLTNVIKHAGATEVNIHITNHGDTLNILVEDNGKGFVTHQITNSTNGMGLKSIDKRVAHLQGSMDIESELTKGTVVIIDIPI